ncbi:gamma-glutamyl AIG2-like cyclotransferase [Sinobacterium caligoides]|uniref:Gamma-glutamyl AIG2-like cyclotransferase n=1 Tax=Sinobacterium caligoides TaxID=933926 RepID=A0A3N2DZ33_9GAMM|nr:gamma-glutamylcyclotransferase family protein [Sinobacterium caligoides]ROS05027.1 gamma-glutamyl AIG2-like cyclotransferase [Sinobacterium caligoides]
MTCYYFAYGSNMNVERMRERGLTVVSSQLGKISDCELLFDKAAHNDPGASYANIGYRQGGIVEGVLHELVDVSNIALLDHFEGTPIRYSRECYPVETVGGTMIAAWVYVANPGHRQAGLRPRRWYLEHLLCGESYLTPSYFAKLTKTRCIDEVV